MTIGRKAGTTFAGLLIATATLASAAMAQAAEPQALALVSTGSPVALRCGGGACTAEFTSFCLQQDRFSPHRGTPYEIVADSDIRLIGMAPDGQGVALDPRQYLRITSARTHLAVQLSVDQAVLDERGLDSVAVMVGDNAALVPQADPATLAQRGPSEAALLRETLRPLGTLIVDRDPVRMGAARITSRMINSAAEGAPVDPTVWQRSLDAAHAASLPGEAIGMARKSYNFCVFAARNRVLSSFKRCLQEEHDGMLRFLNSEFWGAVRTGS